MSLKRFALMIFLVACTATRPGFAHDPMTRTSAIPYGLDIVDEWGNRLSTYQHRGRTYVLGQKGQRYQVRVHNPSPIRVEAVIAVDGRDALDGQSSDWNKRGYLIEPHGVVVIDGFRLNMESVAAFRFSSVRDSYAAKMGNAREVGVIGVAMFPERIEPAAAPLSRADEWSREAPAPAAEPAPSDAASGAGRRSKGSQAPSGLFGLGGPQQKSARSETENRPGLGTEFGEQRASRVYETAFFRARPTEPEAVLAVRYNDRQGLIALGIDVDGSRRLGRELEQREHANPFRSNAHSFAQPPVDWPSCR